MPWDFVLIFVVLGALVPWRSAVQMRALLAQPRLESTDRLAVYASTIALQWLVAGVVLWRAMARGFTPAEMAISMPGGIVPIGITLALTILLVVNQIFSLRRLGRLPAERQGFVGELARRLLPQNDVETLAFFALCATVAVCEEVIYRGFALAALESASGNWILAAVGSSALFAVAHLYQGPRGLITTFFVGLLFAGVREYTGSLAPVVVAHLAVDLTAGVYARHALGISAQRARGPAGGT
ncbi:MAG TPA: type II CAAX endopeptidase family protein [Candidatus Nitrosotenuis sp.]|nr:type II CAAX endopeptidase family protein [Candidatus Nitrosotenuis sp.]